MWRENSNSALSRFFCHYAFLNLRSTALFGERIHGKISRDGKYREMLHLKEGVMPGGYELF
jgi:hypothetical protein